MDCKQIREQLHRSLDGVPADNALREHLAACADCRNELTAMRRVVTGLTALPRATAPVSMMAGVMAAVRQQPLEDIRSKRQRRALSVLAANLALVGILLLAFAAGDVWEALTLANTDSTVMTQDDASDPELAMQAAAVDPVMFAEHLPMAAESGGVAFAAGLCMLFLAGTTELLSLLLPATRPASAEGQPLPSPFQPSRIR